MSEILNIAVVGCLHGKLKRIYDDIKSYEENKNVKIDLVLVCGDFQSTRNQSDLDSMAVPKKYRVFGDFIQYYEKKLLAPILTLFIGGNHEASNYLWNLPYGGFVCKNIYYMGYSNVVDFAGYKIGGISGIYKPYDYESGHHETLPLSDSDIRSIYHTRKFDVHKLMQMNNIDIILSHDWPTGVWDHGSKSKLLKFKPFFAEDIQNYRLGGIPYMEILQQIQPRYFFSAHLHCYFQAHIKKNEKCTRFIALDKTLPRRKYIEFVGIGAIKSPKVLSYDENWLAITKIYSNYFKDPFTDVSESKCNDETIIDVKNRFKDLVIADIWDQGIEDNTNDDHEYPRKQNSEFCTKLDIMNPCQE